MEKETRLAYEKMPADAKLAMKGALAPCISAPWLILGEKMQGHIQPTVPTDQRKTMEIDEEMQMRERSKSKETGTKTPESPVDMADAESNCSDFHSAGSKTAEAQGSGEIFECLP
eukprot:Skav234789  [mRNA]  locus=scaffold69:109728:110072:+ [translate_table: standard]